MNWLKDAGTDLEFTTRLFRKDLGFTLVAVLSIALGIGATSAIFSLVYAVLIDPYPYRNADRIVAPVFSNKQSKNGRIWYTVPDFLEIERDSKTLEDAFLAADQSFIATGGLAERVKGIAFSPNAFQFFGVPAMLGRTFAKNDIPSPQAPPNIAVLSYLFWMRHFQGDPRVVGKSIELNHLPFTILGVLPARFTWADGDVYIPLKMTPDPRRLVPMMGRIRPDTGLVAASAELQAMTERFAARTSRLYPTMFRIHLERLNDWLLGPFEGTLLVLLAAVGLLLLIACSNVSILLLARANARQKEIALRISMGATRARVIRQLLTESVVLAVTGGMLGVLLAYCGVPAIVALMPEFSVPHEAPIHVNGAVVAFSFVIAVATGILFGMMPAVQLARADVREAIQETGRGSSAGLRGVKTRNVLIVTEVALTTVLLACSGVAIRGYLALTEVRLGYDPTNVLALFLSAREGFPTFAARRERFEQIAKNLRQVHGVTSVTQTSTAVPPWVTWDTFIELPGGDQEAKQPSLIGLIGGDFFSTLHIPLLQGRAFAAEDFQNSRRVAVVNEEFVRQYWRGARDAVGRQIQIPDLESVDRSDLVTPPPAPPLFQVVGVVASYRNRGLHDAPRPALYIPYTMLLPQSCVYLIRTGGDPHQLIRALRERICGLDPDQPVQQALTLDELLARGERSYPRFSTTLFTIFASVGLSLSGIGLFSVVSYAVTRRTHEFGIRMALGARAHDVLKLVMRTTVQLVMAGFVLGLGISIALSGFIAKYLEGWTARDPVAFVEVGLVLGCVALGACWLPVRRATQIEPMRALRHE